MTYKIDKIYHLNKREYEEFLRNIVIAGVDLTGGDLASVQLSESSLDTSFCKGFLACALGKKQKTRSSGMSVGSPRIGSKLALTRTYRREAEGYRKAKSMGMDGRIKDIFPLAVQKTTPSKRTDVNVLGLSVIECTAE